MKTPIFCVMIILSFCFLAASRVNAQQTYEYSVISYDDSTDAVYGYSATDIDYACSDNYSAYVEGYLKNQYGTTLDSGYAVHPYAAEVFTSASADQDSYYTVESYHDVIARYYDDGIQKSPDGCWPCDGCNTDCYYFQEDYYWWDPYGFSTSGHTGSYGSWVSFFGNGPYVEVEDDEYFDLGETSDTLQTPAPSKLVRFDYTQYDPGAPDGYGPLVLTANTNNEVRDVTNAVFRDYNNECGAYRNLVYELETKNGDPITAAYSITENFSNYSSTNNNATAPASFTRNISANGIVNDTIYLGKTLPNCLGNDEHEAFDQKFVVRLNGHDYNLTTVVHVSRGKFNGTYKVDVETTTP